MAPHEEFLELCAAATAGELNADERAKLDLHLNECSDCRQAMKEYEFVRINGVPCLAPHLARSEEETDGSWSAESAEKEFFKKLDREHKSTARMEPASGGQENTGQRFKYHPSQIRWREIWMPFAAVALLALALGVAAYRGGVQRGTDIEQTAPVLARDSVDSLVAQASDKGHERAQLLSKLGQDAQVIADLKRQLSEQWKVVNGLKAASLPSSTGSGQRGTQEGNDVNAKHDEELAAAQMKLTQLQKAMDTLSAQRDEATNHAAVLEAKVSELTQLAKDREKEVDQKQAELTKERELLDHDRDFRELIGSRDLYMADIYDVSRTGTNQTHGRVLYTKGKRLLIYAFDLDAQPGVQNASSFQAWGRRGPDKQRALSLGIFYEDNVSKKRWVLKASDPKSLEDIDAVFVTVEPSGGSSHPSGKQLLFAYLNVSANHP